ALLLAAVGAAYVPRDTAARRSGGGSATGTSRSSLAIHWAVVEPLRVLLPSQPSSLTQQPAKVVVVVSDPHRPSCRGGKYVWTFHQEGSIDPSTRVTA